MKYLCPEARLFLSAERGDSLRQIAAKARLLYSGKIFLLNKSLLEKCQSVMFFEGSCVGGGHFAPSLLSNWLTYVAVLELKFTFFIKSNLNYFLDFVSTNVIDTVPAGGSLTVS